MRKILVILSISTFVLLISCNDQPEKKSENQDEPVQESTTEKIHYYTCAMDGHKHIHSDKPGDCPECGMTLVAAVEVSPDSADYYGCPMPDHSHIRDDKPGNCPECNMKLVPMKLKDEVKM